MYINFQVRTLHQLTHVVHPDHIYPVLVSSNRIDFHMMRLSILIIQVSHLGCTLDRMLHVHFRSCFFEVAGWDIHRVQPVEFFEGDTLTPFTPLAIRSLRRTTEGSLN